LWRAPPPPAYLQATGLPADAFTDLDALLAAGRDAGLSLRERAVSDRAAWDRFEGGVHAAVERYAAAHPDEPGLADELARRRRWHEAQLRWGRDAMGFALMLWQRAL
jgi:hypothetical protein